MSAEPLEAAVRERGAIAVVELSGELNGFADEALGVAYRQATAGGARAVLLDFAGVSYINSTGLALVVGLLGQARKAGRSLLVCGLSDHYREIFQLTRLSDFMRVFDDEVSALASLAVSAP